MEICKGKTLDMETGQLYKGLDQFCAKTGKL